MSIFSGWRKKADTKAAAEAAIRQRVRDLVADGTIDLRKADLLLSAKAELRTTTGEKRNGLVFRITNFGNRLDIDRREFAYEEFGIHGGDYIALDELETLAREFEGDADQMSLTEIDSEMETLASRLSALSDARIKLKPPKPKAPAPVTQAFDDEAVNACSLQEWKRNENGCQQLYSGNLTAYQARRRYDANPG